MLKKSLTYFFVVLLLCFGTFYSGFAVSNIDTNNKSLDDLKNLISDNNDGIQGVYNDQQSLEAQYQATNKQLAVVGLSAEQTAALEMSLEQLSFYKGLYTNKRDNQKAIEKYNLQVNYYKTCLLIKQSDLLNNALDVLNLQLTIEQTKLAQGNSTALNVRDLNNQKAVLVNSISEISDNLELSKDNLKDILNMDFDDSFTPSFTIPSVSPLTLSYTLAKLKSDCISKNIDILSADNDIKVQSDYIQKLKLVFDDTESEVLIAKSGLSKMQLNQTVLRKKIIMYVKQAFSQYNQSVSKVQTANERNNILNDQLQVIETNHQLGNISDLQYQQQKYNVNKQLYDINSTLVNYLNIKTLVDLIDKGIYIRQ